MMSFRTGIEIEVRRQWSGGNGYETIAMMKLDLTAESIQPKVLW
jgi:hypothetical protein